ncbi:MAG: hypothetical protein DDG58_00445 [Ardenticatenia bacterium]|nr:MAG: hypothetical protein DDG58_00445 [Ardenticatenia bacterium]
MIEQAPLVLQVSGAIAVLMWLVAFSFSVYPALRMEGTAAHLGVVTLLTRIGLLIGTVGWGSYVTLIWPQLPWRVASLPPVALVALAVHTILARRISKELLSLCWYACAVVAYGAALASLGAGDVREVSDIPSALPWVAIREVAAVVAAGALLTYGAALLIKRYLTQTSDASRAEHLSDGAMRVALWGTTVALAAAAWRAWSVWGEVARADVAALFIAWAFVMAASLWQMITGMAMTRMVHGLALAAWVLLSVMLVVIA